MREIKFKIWDKRLKKFICDGDDILRICLVLSGKYTSIDRMVFDSWLSNLIFLQYTGFKDKNGKEIYEGDVVKIGENLIDEVKWITEKEWMSDKCPVNGFVNHESIYKIKPIIIGNIYENPELLKEQTNED
jgi:uncharacterized phage protein (TIGR01671 family)